MKKISASTIILSLGGLFFAVLVVIAIIFASKPASEKKTEEMNVVEDNPAFDYENYVELGDYKNIALDTKKVTVTEADIDEAIANLLTENDDIYVTDETKIIDERDKVEVTYRVKSRDEENIAETSDNQDESEATQEEEQAALILVGDKNLPEEFKDALIGHTVGDEVKVDVESDGTVYILSITGVLKQGDVTDELVKALNLEGIETVEALRTRVRDHMQDILDEDFETKAKDELMTKVYNSSQFMEMPYDYVLPFRKTIQSIIENTKTAYASEEDFNIDEYIKEQYGEDGVTTAEEFVDHYSKQNANMYAMCCKIASAEGIEVDALSLYSDVAKDWASNLDQYDTLKDFVEKNNMEEYERSVLQDKVAEFLMEQTQNSDTSSQTAETETP